MRDQAADYRHLIRMQPDEVANWIRDEFLRVDFPRRVRGQWIGAMLDIAITDYYTMNKSPGVSMESRFRLAAALLKLAEDSGYMQEIFISDWHMKFARKAVEDGFVAVPPTMTADAVVRRALGCFELTQGQALAVADERRRSYASALDSDLSAEEFREEISRADDRRLLAIEHILRGLLWFAGKITDDNLENDVQSWFDAYGQLGVGEDIANQILTRSVQRTANGDGN